MARPNQGLQIALIIFVLISIALGVTTYMYYKQVDEIIMTRENALKELTVSQNLVIQKDDEIANLKQLIGYPDIALANIKEKFDKYVKEVAPGQEKPTYISIIEGFQNKEKGLNEQIAQLKRDVDDMKGKYAVREGSKEKVIAEANEKFRAANARKDELDRNHKDLIAKRDQGLQGNFAKLESSIKSLEKDVKKNKENVEKAQAVTDEKQKDIARLTDALDKTIRPVMDRPQGKLIYLNPAGSMGLIDLGKADGVTRGLSFTVYEPLNISEQGKKGYVEVISVTDQRRAEVRIFNDDESNPIALDDVLYSPTWAPGFKERFALIGTMDIDGDGGNDLEQVLRLITRNGGVVEAYQKDDGSQEGRISQNVTYVVEGTAPDDNSPELVLTNYTNMKNAVKKLRIKTITLHELLRKMGYRPPSDMQNKAFLSGGDGVKRVSPGNVSQAYQDEDTAKKPASNRKPKVKKNGAY